MSAQTFAGFQMELLASLFIRVERRGIHWPAERCTILLMPARLALIYTKHEDFSVDFVYVDQATLSLQDILELQV